MSTKKNNCIPKKLAIINDLSGYGRCSLAVEIPVVSALGVQACPVPTSILSNHTGFPEEYKVDLTEHMVPYMQAWENLSFSFDGILVGYMNYEAQVLASADFIDRMRHEGTVVYVDPAMADHGKLYRGFDERYVELMRDSLVKRATVIKPNITEACLLTGRDYNEVVEAGKEHTMRRLKALLMNIMEDLHRLGPENIVITGCERGDRIINTICDGTDVQFLTVKRSGAGRPGTGDIFSAITCASLMKGMTLPKAASKAADFISTAIRISEEAQVPPMEGVIFENILSKLSATADSL